MFYSHTHLSFYFLIAINKSSQNESGIATIRDTNYLSPVTMKFKNNFIGKTELLNHLFVSLFLLIFVCWRGGGQNKAKAYGSLHTLPEKKEVISFLKIKIITMNQYELTPRENVTEIMIKSYGAHKPFHLAKCTPTTWL